MEKMTEWLKIRINTRMNKQLHEIWINLADHHSSFSEFIRSIFLDFIDDNRAFVGTSEEFNEFIHGGNINENSG